MSTTGVVVTVGSLTTVLLSHHTMMEIQAITKSRKNDLFGLTSNVVNKSEKVIAKVYLSMQCKPREEVFHCVDMLCDNRK